MRSQTIKRRKTLVEKFVSQRHQFSVGQRVLDRFTITTPPQAGTLGEDYHAIDMQQKKPYVLQVLAPDIANHFDFVDSVAEQLYVCGSIREADLVPVGELIQDGKLRLRMIAYPDYGHESVESRQEIIEAGGKFGVKALLGFLERAAGALDKLALAGRAHLALRPSDIVITSHGTVMLTNWWYNWDLLKAAAQGHLGAAATVQNSLLSGKNSNLAPEVFEALRHIAGFEEGGFQTPNRLADQFSLAVIFGRTLNHSAVLLAQTPLTAVQLDTEKIPFLNLAQRQVIARAVSPDPLDRFETCTAFFKALQWELPGTEYVPDQGFHDLLFEHVRTHHGSYSDGDIWQEFLNRAADRQVFAAGDNIELLNRARFIWEQHLGHAPETPSAPLRKSSDPGEGDNFDTAGETPRQRFERLHLLFEELRLGLSTSGFAAAQELAEQLERAQAAFDRCNPEGDSGGEESADGRPAAAPAAAAADAGGADAGGTKASAPAAAADAGTGTAAVPGTAAESDPPLPVELAAMVARAKAAVQAKMHARFEKAEEVAAAEETEEPAPVAPAAAADAAVESDSSSPAALAAMVNRAQAAAALRVAESSASRRAAAAEAPALAAVRGSTTRLTPPAATVRPIATPAADSVDRTGGAPDDGSGSMPAVVATDSAAVDPIALLDAFAPVTKTPAARPQIDPPSRPVAAAKPDSSGLSAAAGEAMLTEFRESVRMPRMVLDRADGAVESDTGPSAPPIQSPRQMAESHGAQAQAASSDLPAGEAGNLEPHIEYANYCARCGSQMEILDCHFAFVPEGHFVMGREVGKPNERPTHPVQLSTGFFLSMGTVTNKYYKYFVDATDHPSPVHPRRPERSIWSADRAFPPELEDHPVVNVSWNDARLFCAWLTEWAYSHDLLSAHAAIELPTEAQWEFACRGGPSQMRLKQQKIVCERDDKDGTPTVPSLFEPAPPLGLCGMLGNVWEWCLDGYGQYQASPTGAAQVNPICQPEGPNRIIRGGGWRSKLDLCNPYERAELPPHRAEPFLGFRIAVIYRPQY